MTSDVVVWRKMPRLTAEEREDRKRQCGVTDEWLDKMEVEVSGYRVVDWDATFAKRKEMLGDQG
jgi:adenylate cyclase